MSLIPFPNVPLVAGAPQIPRSPLFPPVAQASLGLVQGLLWRVLQTNSQWGIFDSAGNALADPARFTGITGDALEALGLGSTYSTGSVEYTKEVKTSDFPIEKGTFGSYNKVETPATPSVVLILDANEQDRATFINGIDAACKSTNLYSVVTPEVTYTNYSIDRYTYKRAADHGCTLIMIELFLSEIRQVSAQYTSTTPITSPQNPAATSPVDSGKVQPQTPPPSTLKSIYNAFPSLSSSTTATAVG